MTALGTVQKGVVVLDAGHSLPEGARVEVLLPEIIRGNPTLAERLLKHAGTVPGLPSDLADQHDHYLHGTPRR